ncbi:MAG: YkgJ family cysteine cluster protein [Verrucomicrobia bacterium]|nr:YkgJ family cysteine cluster protein [Verrucomicrobiota bacterium]
MAATAEIIDQLCLACGICCNGVLFADVELQPGDDADKLHGLGLSVRAAKFPQPCAALGAGCRCRFYADRPARCRQFECALFKKAAAGEVTVPAALRTIRQTLQLAAQVEDLLRRLGDSEEQRALSLRFQRMRKRIHAMELDEETAAFFGELTLAVHELNLALRREFYP